MTASEFWPKIFRERNRRMALLFLGVALALWLASYSLFWFTPLPIVGVAANFVFSRRREKKQIAAFSSGIKEELDEFYARQ